MKRPEFVTEEDIARWSKAIDEDTLAQSFAQFPAIREVCYAGAWLGEELEKLGCPEDLLVRIQFTAGRLSFGRDAWTAHQKVLEAYKNNELELEPEPSVMN